MALRSQPQQPHGLFPSGMAAFFRRRLGQAMGFILLCLGIVLGVCLATCHPADPSWNLAIEGPVKNLLSFPGAILADAMLQTFGLASVIMVIVLAGWGIRYVFARPLSWISLRVLALAVSLLLATVAISQFQPFDLNAYKWPFACGFGGATGDILLYLSQKLFRSSRFLMNMAGVIYTLAAISLLLISLGVPVKKIISAVSLTCSFFIKAVREIFIYISTWLQRRLNPENLSSRQGSFLNEETSPFFMEKEQPPFANDMTLSMNFEGREKNPGLHASAEDRAVYIADEERVSSPDIFTDSEANDPGMPLKEEKLPIRIAYDDKPDFPENVKPVLAYPSGTVNRGDDYLLPSPDLLDSSMRKTAAVIDPQVMENSAMHLKTVLEEYGVRGEISTVRPGPVVTMYELMPGSGIKSSRVIGLADDIARTMSALSTRIAVIPGRNVIGIELPNAIRETVYLRELLQSESYEKSGSALPLILGKDIGGHPIITDLTRMPHLLVAGTTGSGKSVAINTMILSLLFRLPPDRCKFIMIDPKMLELSVYDGIPHLLSPVVTDPKKAIVALKWAVKEMENRYRAMSKLGVRNVDGYNSRIGQARQTGELLVRRVQTGFDPDSGKPIFENQPLDLETLPFIVIVVDEMADLMLVAGKEIEGAVQRLAQMARAAGIHLIMATQRPSVDVITGTIKANFPTRISFQVTSKIDSRTILGEQGAEQLLGQGDMLYMAGGGRIMRVHGPFVRDDEVERIVAFLKMQGEPSYIESITEDDEEGVAYEGDGDSEKDSLYSQAVELVLREEKASTSFIQRHFKIGYNKAANLIEAMEKNGVISGANHVGKREVLR